MVIRHPLTKIGLFMACWLAAIALAMVSMALLPSAEPKTTYLPALLLLGWLGSYALSRFFRSDQEGPEARPWWKGTQSFAWLAFLALGLLSSISQQLVTSTSSPLLLLAQALVLAFLLANLWGLQAEKKAKNLSRSF